MNRMLQIIAIILLSSVLFSCQSSVCPEGYGEFDSKDCVSIFRFIPGCQQYNPINTRLCLRCQEGFVSRDNICQCSSGRMVKNLQGEFQCERTYTTKRPPYGCVVLDKQKYESVCHLCRPGWFEHFRNGQEYCLPGRTPNCWLYGEGRLNCIQCKKAGRTDGRDYGYVPSEQQCRIVEAIPDCYQYDSQDNCIAYYNTIHIEKNNQCPQGQVWIHKQKKCVVGNHIPLCGEYNNINECNFCWDSGFMAGKTVGSQGACRVPRKFRIDGCKVHKYTEQWGVYECADSDNSSIGGNLGGGGQEIGGNLGDQNEEVQGIDQGNGF